MEVDESVLVSKFYRRPLPVGLTALASAKGAGWARRELQGHNLQVLFELLGRLERGGVDVNAWPGWSCLALCLNGLCLDQNRLWPGPWR